MPGLDVLLQDLRFGWRGLRRSRGTTTIAVATLAVAISLASASYSFVNAAIFRPAPYEDGDRLLAISARITGGYGSWSAVPFAVLDAVRGGATVFERVAAFQETRVVLRDSSGAFDVSATRVDTAVFGALGARAERGRLLTASDIESRAPVIAISDSLWRRRYGAAESVVGSLVEIDGQSYTVVGVLAPPVRFYERSDVWVPLIERPDTVPAARAERYGLFGKLRDGASFKRAEVEVTEIGKRMAAASPAEFGKMSLLLRDGLYDRSRGGFGMFSLFFLGVALAVMLIACVNVGNLLLARGAERRTEFCVRASLGASRWRLIRQSLTESVLLAGLAGIVAMLLSVWMSRLLWSVFPQQGFPAWLRLEVDWRVLAFTALASLVAIAVFGLVPARESARVDLANVLKAGGDAVLVQSAAVRGARRGIVVQMALSAALFVGAALCVRSAIAIARVDPGYQPDSVLNIRATLTGAAYEDRSRQEEFFRQVMQRVQDDPRVAQLALTGGFYGFRDVATNDTRAPRRVVEPSWRDIGFFLPADQVNSADASWRYRASYQVYDDSVFNVIGLPVVRGRGFNASDRAGGALVAIVSDAVARRVWGGADPIGQTFTVFRNGSPVTVIGVARSRLRPTQGFEGADFTPWPDVYLSSRQARMINVALEVRPRRDAPALYAAIGDAASAVDPAAPLWPMQTLARMDGFTSTRMIVGIGIRLLGAFSVCGVLLTLIGIYGVIAFGVTQRTREIGLRVALGADRDDVMRLFVRQGLRFVGIGLGIGLVLAVGLGRMLRLFLVGTSSFDPPVFAITAVVFIAVAWFSCWLPARRALRVEPLEALRSL